MEMRPRFATGRRFFVTILFLKCFVLLSSCDSMPSVLHGEDALSNSLSAWRQTIDKSWVVNNGEIQAIDGAGDTMLATIAEYDDFKMSVEFWIDQATNSGIFIRCSDAQKISPYTCYEVNIWDDHPKKEYRTGSIVFYQSPPLIEVQSVNQWNRMSIIAKGESIDVIINGYLTASIKHDAHKAGFIALQRFNNGLIKFRDIKIDRL